MAGSFSDYLENEVLDHVFKTGTFTQPTNIYVGLTKSTITDAHTGSTVPSEVSGGAYARVTCNTWDAASSGATENTGAVTFAQATADWGTVTYFFLADAITAGNMLSWGNLTTSKAVSSGDTLKFATGDIDVTLA